MVFPFVVRKKLFHPNLEDTQRKMKSLVKSTRNDVFQKMKKYSEKIAK